MLKIKLYTKDGQPLTMFENYIGLEFETYLNKEGKGKITVNYNDIHLSNEVLKLGNKIEIYYIDENKNPWKQFEGLISGFNYTENYIDIYFIDYLNYLKYRLLRVDKTYTNLAVQDIINDLYNYFNGIYSLLFTLGKNDITTTASFSFKTGKSFLDILKDITKIIGEFRIVDGKLDFSNQTGENKDGIFKYDITDLQGSLIEKFSLNFTLNEFANAIIISDGTNKTIKEDTTSIMNNGLFEKYFYNPEGDIDLGVLVNLIKLPKITVSNRIDWWTHQVGDRKNIRINVGYDYLNIDYIGPITGKKVKVNNGLITCDFILPERYKEVKDIGGIIQFLDKRINKLEVN